MVCLKEVCSDNVRSWWQHRVFKSFEAESSYFWQLHSLFIGTNIIKMANENDALYIFGTISVQNCRNYNQGLLHCFSNLSKIVIPAYVLNEITRISLFKLKHQCSKLRLEFWFHSLNPSAECVVSERKGNLLDTCRLCKELKNIVWLRWCCYKKNGKVSGTEFPIEQPQVAPTEWTEVNRGDEH